MAETKEKIRLVDLYYGLSSALTAQNLVNKTNTKATLQTVLEGKYMVAFGSLTLPSFNDIDLSQKPPKPLINDIKKDLRELRKSPIIVSKVLYKFAKSYFKTLESLRKKSTAIFE